jgi:DNA-binding NtrC family response regulator
MRFSVLIAEDERTLRELVATALRDEGCEVTSTGNGSRALETLGKQTFDLLITDIRLPGTSGMDLLVAAKRQSPDTAVILITAYATVEQAVSALKNGAHQYIRKPFEMDELLHHVRHLRDRAGMRREIETLRMELSSHRGDQELLGHSEAMDRVRELTGAVADGETNVLITGPSGTGKSLAARCIHRLSPRRGGEFVTVNCAALPESLLESQLFGHEPGSFTGATKRHRGYFEQAAGGTLFLDEIGDLSPAAQATVLQAIQERTFHRVGGTKPIEVDFRLVSATNQPLEERVKVREFRLDLFYRLNVVEITIPPLKDRPEDIPVLTTWFLQRFCARRGIANLAFSPEAWSLLLSHPFEGNARELENLVERAVLLCKGPEIQPQHLPPAITDAAAPLAVGLPSGESRPLKEVLQAFEKSYIERVLATHDGNRTQTAKTLGISRKHLWTKLQQLGIQENGTASAEA